MATTQDITELIHTLRHEPMRPSKVLKASDALEALVAERDALRARMDQEKQEPRLTSPEVNDACQAFVETMPHRLPGPVFDVLKPAILSAILTYLKAVKAPQPAASEKQEPVADRALLERTLTAMEGVIDVADRKTDEFDALRACILDLTLMLYSSASRHPAPQPAALQPLKFNTWTHNDGDSWFEHPSDAQIIYDTLGDNPKVGDEFQVRASVSSIHQTYRITSVSPDGECEVELVEAAHGIGAKP